jgi:hypothetical protein
MNDRWYIFARSGGKLVGPRQTQSDHTQRAPAASDTTAATAAAAGVASVGGVFRITRLGRRHLEGTIKSVPSYVALRSSNSHLSGSQYGRSNCPRIYVPDE